jgi:hypothetical protein
MHNQSDATISVTRPYLAADQVRAGHSALRSLEDTSIIAAAPKPTLTANLRTLEERPELMAGLDSDEPLPLYGSERPAPAAQG